MILLFLIITFVNLISVSANAVPVIGILTAPPREIYHGGYVACIPSTVVHFIESAGAQVVPLLHTTPTKKLHQLMKTINGVVLPPGKSEEQEKVAQEIAAQAFKMNEKHREEFFPLLAIQEGMTSLLDASLDGSPLPLQCDFDALKYPTKLNFTPAGKTSKFLSSATHTQISVFETKDFAYHSHKCAVPVDEFKNSFRLNNRFRIVSTSQDRKGKSFVSTLEAYDTPITGIMWRPDKMLFSEEIQPERALDSNQMIAFHFVSEAIKNNNEFTEMASTIHHVATRLPSGKGEKDYYCIPKN